MCQDKTAQTESELRRDIAYLERAVLSLANASEPSAQDAFNRNLSQLRRRRKQLRALQASDLNNWPRYPDGPLESVA